GLDQLGHLARREVFAFPIFAVRLALRHDCSFFAGWRYQLEVQLGLHIGLPRSVTARIMLLFRAVVKPIGGPTASAIGSTGAHLAPDRAARALAALKGGSARSLFRDPRVRACAVQAVADRCGRSKLNLIPARQLSRARSRQPACGPR